MGKSFGEILKERREYANLSQSELAEKIGLEIQQVQRYERNKVKPKPGILTKIQEILNFDFSEGKSISFDKAQIIALSASVQMLNKEVSILKANLEKISIKESAENMKQTVNLLVDKLFDEA
jgi:transcriptional regulator with XRE-family HTH domain